MLILEPVEIEGSVGPSRTPLVQKNTKTSLDLVSRLTSPLPKQLQNRKSPSPLKLWTQKIKDFFTSPFDRTNYPGPRQGGAERWGRGGVTVEWMTKGGSMFGRGKKQDLL